MHRFELSDESFALIAPLLPSQSGKVGRKRTDDHQVLNGILWVLRSGAPWRDLPERYGNWKTVNSRFYRWSESGLWQAILKQLQSLADDRGVKEWALQYVDASPVRAHGKATGKVREEAAKKATSTGGGAASKG